MRNGSYIRALGRMSFEPLPTQSEQTSSSQETGSGDYGEGETGRERERERERDRERERGGATQPADNVITAASLYQTNSQVSARDLQTSLIRAQNDVLATVGVCLAESHIRPNEEIVNQVIRENVVGTYVRILEMIAGYLAGWPLINIRNRTQTFRTFEHVRFIDIIRQTYPAHSILAPFVGMPAHLCFQASRVAMDYVGTRFLMWLMNTELCLNPETGKLRRHSVLAIQILDNGFQLLSWCIFFPLYEYSTLQSLQLIAPFPLLPPLHSFKQLPFGPSSISTGTGIFPSWLPSTVLRVIDSYVMLSFLHSKLYVNINEWLAPILSRSLLPRPVNPDQASRLVGEAEHQAEIEELPARRRRRRRSEARRAAEQANNESQSPEPDESTMATNGATERQSDQLGEEWDGEWVTDEPETPATRRSTTGRRDIDGSELPDTGDASNRPSDTVEDTVEDYVLEDLEFLPIGTHVPETTETTLPIHPPRSSSFAPPGSRRHQQNQQSSGSEQNQDPRSTPSHLHNRPLHRVTNLSCYPCDAAAGHIAEAFATGITLGLESAVLRSIARQYLGRQNNLTARGLHISSTYTPRELYSSPRKLLQWNGVLKSLAIELVTTWGLWEVTYWGSTWLGLSMFGYHS